MSTDKNEQNRHHEIEEVLVRLRSRSTVERMNAAEALAAGFPLSPDFIERALKDKNWRVRWGMTHALGRAEVSGYTSVLKNLLEDSQPRVARTAAWALGRTRATEAITALSASLTSPDFRLAAASAWALGHIGDPDALESLAAALQSAPEHLVRSIRIAFSELGSQAALTLVQLLETGDPTSRSRSSLILSRFGTAVVPLVLPLLSSADVRQRRAAAHVLGSLKGPRQKSDAGKASDDETISTIGSALMEALADQDSRVRRHAARSMGLLGFASAIPQLESMLKTDPEDARIAANALSAIGDTSAGPALRSACEAWNAAGNASAESAARRALEKLGLASHTRQPIAEPPVTVATHSDFAATVTPGLEAVAWEEIAEKLPGSSLQEFRTGVVLFRWTGSPQACAILRSARAVHQGGSRPKEILLARRLRRYRVRSLPASLEPTTAYNVARLANMGERDVFVDLSCGSASIALERSLDGPARAILAGDIEAEALDAARENIAAGSQPVQLIRWDARSLPLADQSVSAVSANLPYGRRSGHSRENQELYPSIVDEVDRVLREGGIAILLSTDKKLMRDSLRPHSSLIVVSERDIEAGGLRPTVFVIQKDTLKHRP